MTREGTQLIDQLPSRSSPRLIKTDRSKLSAQPNSNSAFTGNLFDLQCHGVSDSDAYPHECDHSSSWYLVMPEPSTDVFRIEKIVTPV